MITSQATIHNDEKPCILIADDDADILDALKMILEMHDYRVETVNDGSVSGALSRVHPRLVLLDILMSGNDGRTICKSLKKDSITKDIPVILCSASTNIEKSTRDSGANDYITKPFNIDELLGKIKKHMVN